MPDKRALLESLRERLAQVIEAGRLGRTAFAKSLGIDRSTLSQILSPANSRLPRLETLAAIAKDRQVSIDWLLGLSQEGGMGADILHERVEITQDSLTEANAAVLAWHREAVGYKVRYVPATLPDLLKNAEVIQYELAHFATNRPDQAITTARARLAIQRRPETDMEACNSTQAIESFARGEGIWRGMPANQRRSQLEHMAQLSDELYPRFRWFLYDGRQRYSAPVTIFGPRRAAIYLGQMFLVVQSTEHIRALSQNFDSLIRAATVHPPEIPGFLLELRRGIS